MPIKLNNGESVFIRVINKLKVRNLSLTKLDILAILSIIEVLYGSKS